MEGINEQALEELLHRGRWLGFADFVRLIEQEHPHDEPGVPRDVLTAYATAIVDDLGGSAPFTVEEADRLIDRHLTDSGVWLEYGLYEVGPDRVSAYPAPWHDRLDGETDPRAYVEVMRDELAAARGFAARGADAPGVPKQQLLDAMAVLGRMDRGEATVAVDDERKRGGLELYPFQNPEAEVRLADRNEAAESGAADDERGDGERSPSSPLLVDVRDDLRYLKENGDETVRNRIDGIETELASLAGEDVLDRERSLDGIERALLAIRLENDGGIERRAIRARDRIRIYRRALENASEGLAVVDRKIRHAHTGHVASVAPLRDQDAEIHATIHNEGRPRDVIAVATFYDRDHGRVSKARSRRTRIEEGTNRTARIPVHVPLEARYYTVTPLDVADYAIEYRIQ